MARFAFTLAHKSQDKATTAMEWHDIRVDDRDPPVAALCDGPADGPLALCLHGFPDTPKTWRHVGPELARAGWRVVAPFLGGFGPNGATRCREGGAAVLGMDANRLHAAVGADDRAVVIGHDWGAAAAYAASAGDAERWSRVVALSWPPRPVDVDLASLQQMRRSWYVFLFQLASADALVADHAFIKSLWAEWSANYDASEDVLLAVEAIHEGEGSALRHYRALFRDEALPLPLQPTLYLHGERDGCIGVELAAGLEAELAPGSRVVRLSNVGHFPHLETSVEVAEHILAFIGAVSSGNRR